MISLRGGRADSWELWRDDLCALGTMYCIGYDIDYEDIDDARDKQAEDLERRAKKLAGVE